MTWKLDDDLVSTEVVETSHGDVEFDTVECSVCGESVRVEDAIPVGVGVWKDTCENWQCVKSRTKPRARRAVCEYCAEGVFDYRSSAGRVAAEWYARHWLGWRIVYPALIGLSVACAITVMFL